MTVMGGGSQSNGDYWTWHLQRTDGGQSFAIRDVVGLMGQDMGDWFAQMEAMAAGGKTERYFYHFHLDPREGEAFTPDQLKVAVATALENLGLEDQPYFLVEHDKEGRSPHFHCIVLRVNLDTGKAISDSHDYRVHQLTADQLEELFGHERTTREHGPDGPNPKNYEVQRGQRTSIDPKTVAAELKALWHQCDNGQAFAAALEERGYILARGDRRDFVVVDQAGSDHSLARRVGGKAAEVRARMASVDRDNLPTVSEARALARERAAADDTRDEKQRDASPLPAQHDQKHSAGSLQSIAEELAETVGHPAREKQPPAPAPEYVPIQTRERSLFERLAQKAADAIRSVRDDETIAESVDPLAQPTQRHPAEVPPRAIGLAGFDRAATEFIQAAEEAAPVGEQLAVAAASIIERRPIQEEPAAERSTFDRFASDMKQAMHEGGGEPSAADGWRWLAEQAPPAPSRPEPSAFGRFVQKMKDGMRARGGNPDAGGNGSFWQRSAALFSDAVEQAATWAKQLYQGFADRFAQRPQSERDDPGMER